ncbi:MAG: amidase family protein [Microthrixaceae bacterium]|nr:amidase family protein [Microthrixaceae bacterium]
MAQRPHRRGLQRRIGRRSVRRNGSHRRWIRRCRLHQDPRFVLRRGGFQPSFGRVPAEYGFDQTIVHHGPLARTVADAALMLSVIEGFDARDPRSVGASGIDPGADLHAGIAGRSVGWAPGLPGFEVNPEVATAVQDAAEVFSADLGCRLAQVEPGWGTSSRSCGCTGRPSTASSSPCCPRRDSAMRSTPSCWS